MKKFFFFMLFVLTLQFSFAQSDSIKATMDEVLVTATKTSSPYYSIGSSVSVVTSDMISRKQLKTVAEVLRDVPGVYVSQQGGPGKLAYVFMRGANSNHTLVTLDGVEMNDPSSPSNAFDFSNLNVKEIDRIEVVRGPQSTLYGSDAIAGIINIITKQGNGKPRFSFDGEGGSNSYFRGNLTALGSYGNLNYAIVASQSASDGISAASSIYGNKEKDSFSNTGFSSRFDLHIANNWQAGFIYKFLNAKTDLDQNDKLGDDPNFTYKVEEHVWKANVATTQFNNVWNSNLSFAYIKHFANSVDLFDATHPKNSSDSYSNAKRFKIDWQNNINVFNNNLITIGVDRETESAATSYFSTSAWGPYKSIFPHEQLSNTGLYVQDQINFVNALFTTAGFRYDMNEKFGSAFTYRIAPAYFINSTGTKLKASLGSGFKAPSLYYLFNPLYGNKDLKPEKSFGYDFGIEQTLLNNKLFLGLTYFKINMNDMFGYDSKFKTINIAKAKTGGFEFVANAIINIDFSVSANYSFTETKDESETSADFGKTLLRRPKHQASVNANYKLLEALNMNLNLRYVGKRDDKDFSSFPAKRIVLPDYLVVNFALSYQLLQNLSLSARVENFFDRKYEEVLYYGTLGRSLYFGLNYSI